MNDTLLGVLIGGGITIAGSLLAALLQHYLDNKRHKREQEDEIKKSIREKKEKAYYQILSFHSRSIEINALKKRIAEDKNFELLRIIDEIYVKKIDAYLDYGTDLSMYGSDEVCKKAKELNLVYQEANSDDAEKIVFFNKTVDEIAYLIREELKIDARGVK